MNWYLIHTKPKQELSALQNLEQQGYVCYLPYLFKEKISMGKLEVAREPLFPRYLFIQLDNGDSGKSWSPIRSTKGVSRLVAFGNEPAKVDNRLIDLLKLQEDSMRTQPAQLFVPGDRVQLTEGPLAGIQGVYQMMEGQERAMVLIELLSKPVRLGVLPTNLRKAS